MRFPFVGLAVPLLSLAAACGDNLAGGVTGPPDAMPPQVRPNSNLALAKNGGGCYPSPLHADQIHEFDVVNPEWAPVIHGSTIDSEPVLVHGTVDSFHGDTGGDFPAGHNSSDANVAPLLLDAEDAFRAASGNGEGRIEIEWEAGSFPAWAWPGPGDREIVLGRWIFDCGHPNPTPGACSATTSQQCAIDDDCGASACPSCTAGETCVGTQFNYESEIHPPQAIASIRQGRGGLTGDVAAVPATRADVWVSPDGGASGDRCVLTHFADLPSYLYEKDCFPLAEPVAPINAVDFEFDMPLPPKPAGAGEAQFTIIPRTVFGGIPAKIEVTSHENDSPPTMHVAVRMTQKSAGGLTPTGYAGTITVGWHADPTPLTHVRVTVTGVKIHNALQPKTPIIHENREWRGQVSVNGEWQTLENLGVVSTGAEVPQHLVFDQFLPADGKLALSVDGVSGSCIDTEFGKSFSRLIEELNLGEAIACLKTISPDPGKVDRSFDGPDFGAGTTAGGTTYETRSLDGDGGTCSTAGTVCLVDADCPSGETCPQSGGAFTLQYTVEKIP